MGLKDGIARNWIDTDHLLVAGAQIAPIAEHFWFVNADKSATGDGTSWDNAFLTIQEGVDACGDGTGDVVLVAEGKYQENVLIKDHEGIKIIAINPGWATQVRASDATTKYPFTPTGGSESPGVCFAVISRSVEISGFNCDGGGGYAGIYIGDGTKLDADYNENSAGVKITNCLLRGGNEGSWGIALDGCSDNVIIENNVFEELVSGGIHISAGGSRTCQRPIIRRNEFIDCRGYGIYTYNHNTTIGIVVRENTFMDGSVDMTYSVLFQGTGEHIMVGNYDCSANGALGSATDWMAGNFEQHGMNLPKYVAEA